MEFFDKVDPRTLDRRDGQLSMLSLGIIVVLGLGLALLMYPAVFGSNAGAAGTLRERFSLASVRCACWQSPTSSIGNMWFNDSAATCSNRKRRSCTSARRQAPTCSKPWRDSAIFRIS